MQQPDEDPGYDALTPEQRRRAALAVCARAQGAVDARTLLDMLGLLDAVRLTRLSA